MGLHQEQSFLRLSQRAWNQILIVLCLLLSSSIIIPNLASTFAPSPQIDYVQQINKIIDAHKLHLEGRDHAHQHDIRSFLGGLFGGDSSTSTAAGASSSSGGLLGTIESAIGGALTGDLAMPAMSLGTGLANGTLTGLNMTMPASMVAAMKSVSGVSLLAQNLGSGLMSTIVGAVNISSLTSSLTDANSTGGTLGGANGTAGLSVLALAQGLGGGTAIGLGMMSKTANTSFYNTTGVPGIAGNFGQGLTQTLVGGINITTLMKSLGMSSTTGSSKAVAGNDTATDGLFGGASGTVGQAVLSLAQGIGGGAASGLKLTTNTKLQYNTSGINGIAGNFGQGLTQSLLTNVDISSLASGLVSSTKKRSLFRRSGLNTSSLDIPAIAVALGTGLGQGAAVGLGYQNDSSPMNISNSDIPGMVNGFAKGLVSSFLINGTVTNLVASFNTPTPPSELVNSTSSNSTSGINLSNLNVAKVAEGLAIGLISGVGSQVTSFQIVNGNTSSFDDSVGGASNGFGYGLGSSGASLIKQLITKPSPSPSPSPSTKRSLIVKKIPSFSGKGPSTHLVRREDSLPTNLTNITTLGQYVGNLNSSIINPLVQTGMNDLTCTGIGGIVGIGLGMYYSGTITLDTLKSLRNSSSNLTLPNQDFNFTMNGNSYAFNPAKGLSSAKINDTGAILVIVFLVLHILFAFIIYYNIIPQIMIFKTYKELTRQNQPIPALPKWVRICNYIILPSSFLIFIFGIVARGNGKHFFSGHGIIGLLTFLLTLSTTFLDYKLTNPPLLKSITLPPLLSHPLAPKLQNLILLLFFILTFITGVADVSSLSFCVLQQFSPVTYLMMGFTTLGPFMLAGAGEVVLFLIGRKGNLSLGGEKGGYGYENADAEMVIGKPVLIGRSVEDGLGSELKGGNIGEKEYLGNRI